MTITNICGQYRLADTDSFRFPDKNILAVLERARRTPDIGSGRTSRTASPMPDGVYRLLVSKIVCPDWAHDVECFRATSPSARGEATLTGFVPDVDCLRS
ncbi:MAG: hypothetical protein CBARDMAM_6063 [uncultured Caballeronia sp.]|nr:MAG: hypothetical protein CBARDMAM_6063 [uncultured Caballeronia sp.]